MTDYLEIVENPGQDQPWHNRIVAGNHETTWTTETFHDEDSAADSLVALARMFSPVDKATLYRATPPAQYAELHLWLDQHELGEKLVVQVRHTTVLNPSDDGTPIEGSAS